MALFTDLPLQQRLLDNLESLKFTQMTEVQAQSLPPLLQGQDVIAKAKTGSGKTLAFALTVLNGINVKFFAPQALVMCPTRELGEQVAGDFRQLARLIGNVKVLTLCGGQPFGPQKGSLAHGAHIIVGTPGRLEEHLRKGFLKPEHIAFLVLDEADRMLDMGFVDEITAIIKTLPPKRQNMLFSATYPGSIAKLGQSFMQSPKVITTQEAVASKPNIDQRFYQVTQQADINELLAIIGDFAGLPIVVFSQTKKQCQKLAIELQGLNFAAIAIHGDLEQRERTQALYLFASQSAQILCATDVAARGLDIDNVGLVVNMSLGNDIATYVHRIGRTGRAGKKGTAITFVHEKAEHAVALLQDYLQETVVFEDLPNKEAQPWPPEFVAIDIAGGKKDKLRPGDIVGALTSDKQLAADDIGKIQCKARHSFVAVKRQKVKTAMALLQHGIKKKRFKSRIIKFY